MAVLRLTSANLSFVKRSLRVAFPDVKSSHLTEGLAAAVGKNTHAALLALTSGQAEAEPVQLDRERWRRRLAELGYPNISGEPLAPIVRHDELPNPCWRVIGKRDLPAINAWFYQCRRDDIPDIYVSVARKYARLEWDCISTNGDGDKGITGKGSRELGRTMFATFQRLATHDSGKPMYKGSPFVGAIERLDPATAFTIADTFFLMLFPATRSQPPQSGVTA
jgi:hypothetical protein